MLSIKQLRTLAAFTAGRLMAKEKELGQLKEAESDENKIQRVNIALAELLDFLATNEPALLSPSVKQMYDDIMLLTLQKVAEKVKEEPIN